MCIVTYFPTDEGFIFTSNRDEKRQRPTLEPASYDHPTPLIYPKDLDHGGTWFAVDSKQKQLFCILNAAGKQPNSVKKISRGQLPIHLLLGDESILSASNLTHIAPFQLLKVSFLETTKIEHFHWDGTNFESSLLDISKPKLWCSNTLYSEEKSKDLKNEYMKDSSQFTSWNDLISFHKNVSQPLHNNVFLKKDKGLQTVSITSLCLKNKNQELYYDNLLEKNQYFKKAI
tara:strand:+ start:1342 stop:2031 length:690 start_codon:yes stop_codon:yes gene_type:complete